MNLHNNIQQADNRSGVNQHYVDMAFDFITGRRKSTFQGKKIEVLQSKLIQSHKMESVGKLAGGIAHDFNNIMTTIIGFADLIEMEGKVDDTTMEYICEIQKSG